MLQMPMCNHSVSRAAALGFLTRTIPLHGLILDEKRQYQCRSQHRRDQKHFTVNCLQSSQSVVRDGSVRIFQELLEETGELAAVELRPGPHGHGLFLTRSVTKGEVILRVPMEYCLVVDYEGEGLRLPNFAWPRLREAVQQNPELPWDVLLAVALLDTHAGQGGAFWRDYTRELLPQPAQLSLPFCLPPQLLEQLQDADIIQGAQQQQERLAQLLPKHAQPVEPGACTWMQWAFACVRSRAFRLGPECHAIIPFVDMANHALPPVAAFRPHRGAIELLAVREAAAEDEATISYALADRCINKQLMQVYGFVIPGGNPADRLPLDIDSADSDAPDRHWPGEALSLQRIEYLLGDQVFLEMLSGKHPYLTAAMKSLPLEEGGPLKIQPGDPVPDQERRLAERLIGTCEEIMQGGGTTLEEDCGLRDKASDPRMAAVFSYRIERKALAKTAHALLRLYITDRHQ